MPPLFDPEPAVGSQLRLAGPGVQSVQCLGVNSVHIRSYSQALQQQFSLRSHCTGQLPQDPFDFFPFFRNIALNIIIQVDHGHRLNEEGCSRTALVMDDTGEIGSVLLLDRDHIPIPPHGDKGILKIFLVIGIMEYLLQLGTHLAFGGSDTDPKTRQLHRRRVQYLSFFRNRFVQLPHQLREFRQASSILCQIGMVVAVRQQEHFQGAEGLHACLHLHKFLHVQHAADAGPLHRICNIVQTPKGKAPALIQNPESLCRLHMHTLYRFKIRRNRKGQQPFFTQIRSSLFRSQHFHFFKFQRFNGKTPGDPIIHKKVLLKSRSLTGTCLMFIVLT